MTTEAQLRHFIEAKSQVDFKLFSSSRHPSTMPCYFAFSDENATPICSRDESAHMKSTCYGFILQHQPTINLFIQNLPCKALDVLRCGIKGNGNVTFQNLTSIHRIVIDVAFENTTQRTPKNPTSHNPSCKMLMELAFHNLSHKAEGCTNNVVRSDCDHIRNKRRT